jgi:hypothetical protein
VSVYVFVGPTLGWDDARCELDATLCPPAAAGDVYRVACRRPRAIGIVDGFFERVPSVWHKEILWAMSEGIHVFGAASMGALRAAELADYGMQGVGQIFSAFRSGELEDDDEVAVAHAEAEHGYRSISDAMVNIRATLASAAAQGVVTGATRAALESIAKGLFYADRTYEGVVREGESEGLPRSELQALRGWLPGNRRDVKREDAVAMLHAMRTLLEREYAPKTVAYRFEHTHTWESLQRHCRTWEGRPTTAEEEAIFDELRLRGEFVGARRAALARLLALAQARESGKPIPDEAVRGTAETVRRERGLLSTEEFARWLKDNRLDSAELDRFLRDEARVRWVDESLSHASAVHLADHLRLTGEYASLRRRADEKDQALAARGIGRAGVLLPVDPGDQALWRWYFVEWLRRGAVPDDVDRYASQVGFPDLTSFRGAVLREYLARAPGPPR